MHSSLAPFYTFYTLIKLRPVWMCNENFIISPEYLVNDLKMFDIFFSYVAHSKGTSGINNKLAQFPI